MSPDLHARMLDLARFHVGITERGDNQGEMVQLFQRAVDGKASGEPWCMAFLQYVATKTIEVHGGRLAVFRSESCLEVWNKTPPAYRLNVPKPGHWAIWQHGTSSAGHAEIVDVINPYAPTARIQTIGGNTSPEPGAIKMPDGVYFKNRSIDFQKNERMTLLGFLRVFV